MQNIKTKTRLTINQRIYKLAIAATSLAWFTPAGCLRTRAVQQQ